MAKLPGAIQGARIVGEQYAKAQRQKNPEGRMPLFDHLRELRNRVVKSALALAAGMAVGFVFFSPVWHFIEKPLCEAYIRGHTGCQTLGVNQLVLNGPLDAFYLRVKVALIVGIILSSPVWLYQVWSFIAPGLYAREKRCALMVELAELIVWRHDRRKARLHPDPYAGLADDELSPIDLNGLDDPFDDGKK